MRTARTVLLGLAALAGSAPAAPAQAPPPSLTLDLSFAPPSGIARSDFTSGTVADIPADVAVDGDRIYTVGRTQGGTGGQDIGVIARKTDGTFDSGFSGDGRLIIPIAQSSDSDIGTGIAVLPDGRLRVLAATDVATSGESLDVAIVGLNADGTPDATFGSLDARGNRRVVFPAGPSSDVPARITAGPGGRLAIVGSRSDGSRDDVFVSLREADGSPVPGFGNGGVRFLNRGGVVNATSLIDRGVDVAFRPGGGLVALVLVETHPGAQTDYAAVLHAFKDDGTDDAAFSDDGDLVLAVGEPDTIPGGLIVHAGRLWAAGYTRVGVDTDAFIARVEADGSGLQSRRFDMRGTAVAASQPTISRALDLAVVPGTPPTLVAAGSIDYGSPSTTDWAAAAFNDFDGDLAQAGFGDVVLQAPGQGGLLAVAAGSDGWLAVAGTHIDATSTDNSFGNARLLVDAEKRCDLAVSVAEPAEIVFRGTAAAALTAQVANIGTRACAGTLSVPAPYRMAPIETGTIAAGAAFTAAAVPIAYAGARRGEDVLPITVSAPADANAANNQAAAHVVFSFCDLVASAVGRAGSVPTEGRRRFGVSVRNAGTSPCRVRIAGRGAYSLPAGKSAADRIAAGAPRGAVPGARVTVTLRAPAADDVDPASNAVAVRPRVVGVGDSDVRRHGPRGFSGVASRGQGALPARRLRPEAVHVALLRTGGKRCAWLRSSAGTFVERKPGAEGGCGRARWVLATGTGRWRLRLARALGPGRYVLRSRVTIGAGFPEASFSSGDGNRVEFQIP
ncbi:MAG TPA: hypothetical protein VE526_01330 [Solirubrobacteraceae bacterium]|nr:hypothetical protein [Solirubrobacteraceae bacterium]